MEDNCRMAPQLPLLHYLWAGQRLGRGAVELRDSVVVHPSGWRYLVELVVCQGGFQLVYLVCLLEYLCVTTALPVGHLRLNAR